MAPGNHYDYFEGAWAALLDFASLSPVRSGDLNNISLSSALAKNNFGFEFTGYVDVPSDGLYTFYLISDDGSALYIGDTKVVDNDGLHGSREALGIIGLEAGKHAIRTQYFERSGGEVLQVMWEGPGIEKQTLPAEKLFRDGLSVVARTSAIDTRVQNNKTASLPGVDQTGNTKPWEVSLYPNPVVGDQFSLLVDGIAIDNLQIVLMSLDGKLHKISPAMFIEERGSWVDIDISGLHLPQGIYIIRLQSEDGQEKNIKVRK